jgi:PadR family transcriptional regulator, regulatory protein PadR
MNTDRFGKDLATGSYDLVVLDVLRDGQAYGYEILKRIYEQSRGTIRWRSGTLYRVLHDLERRRMVVSQWRGREGRRRRRYYRLTERGRREWARQRERWRQFTRGVNALLGLKGDTA